MRLAAFAVVAVLAGCGAFVPTPAQWNPATGDVDCSGCATKATVGAAVFALFAAGSFYAADHPSPTTYDKYGYPSLDASPAFRFAGDLLVGASAITAAVAGIEWATYPQCHEFDARLQALIAAPDCATVVRLAGELAPLAPQFRRSVLADDSRVARCIATQAAIARGSDSTAANEIAAELDRGMVVSGVASVSARLTACGDRSSVKGTVKVHVEVDRDGRVGDVSVESAPDAELAACVVAVMHAASFAETRNGGSFSYPVVF